MATFLELEELTRDGDLNRRAAIAVTVAVTNVRNATATGAIAPVNQAQRLVWAKSALQDIHGMARSMLPGVLAENKNFTVAQIQGASDDALLSNIEDYVDIFAGS